MDAERPTESIIAKIRKLLAKAEATDHEAEAAVFQAKAAELLAQHRIDPSRLGSVDRDDLTIRAIVVGRGAYVRARLQLLDVVAGANDCVMAWTNRSDQAVAHVAGTVRDAETAEVMYHSLHTQAATRMAARRRSTAAATQRWRRAFLFGFADRLAAQFAEARAAAAASMSRRPAGTSAEPGRSAELALAARSQRARQHLEAEFGRARAARAPDPANRTGWVDGQQAASGADIGRGRVGGANRALGRGAA